ncbi:hypothetical protein V2J09_007425 [Rumex salicifolius]
MAHDSRRSSVPSFDDTLSSLDRRISRLSAADHPIWSANSDSSPFLDALDELLFLIRERPPIAGQADDLLQKAMFRLEMEFRTLLDKGSESFDLTRNGDLNPSRGAGDYGYGLSEEEDDDEVFVDADGELIPIARPVSDYNILIEALPAETIGDLHEIAKRMVVAGYEKESSHAYSDNRREFLEESLSRLGLQKLSIDELQKMEWSDLEEEVERWTIAVNVALRILFPSERRLCERVFSGYPTASDLSFMEVCRSSAIQLLNFADAVAIGTEPPERLFKVLDVYETLGNLMKEFELLFSNQYCAILRTEAAAIWKRLGESIRGIFMELENLIRRDPAKKAAAGGGVHPITRYVMNYLRAACKSRKTLESVFAEGGDHRKSDGRASTTSLYVQIAWILELLDSNLEANSRIYKDNALSSVFMMNNGRYILQKIQDNDLGELLGEDWIKKQNAKFGLFHMNYQKSSWNKAIGALKLDNVGTASLRERINLFSNCLDETCKAQSSWVVADDQLREELKIVVAETLTSAYRKFLQRFRNSPEVGRNAASYIKYSVEEVDARINNELFQGSGRKR